MMKTIQFTTITWSPVLTSVNVTMMNYPMAHDIVKGVEPEGDIMQWWLSDTKSNNINDGDNAIHDYHMVTSSVLPHGS